MEKYHCVLENDAKQKVVFALKLIRKREDSHSTETLLQSLPFQEQDTPKTALTENDNHGDLPADHLSFLSNSSCMRFSSVPVYQ